MATKPTPKNWMRQNEMNKLDLNYDRLLIDSQTHFRMDGSIAVYPCLYEADKSPIMSEMLVTLRCKVQVMDSGHLEIIPYREGSRKARYTVLFRTEHCTVRLSTSGRITEKWDFPSTLSMNEVWDIRRRENEVINSYFLTAKEAEQWKVVA